MWRLEAWRQPLPVARLLAATSVQDSLCYTGNFFCYIWFLLLYRKFLLLYRKLEVSFVIQDSFCYIWFLLLYRKILLLKVLYLYLYSFTLVFTSNFFYFLLNTLFFTCSRRAINLGGTRLAYTLFFAFFTIKFLIYSSLYSYIHSF